MRRRETVAAPDRRAALLGRYRENNARWGTGHGHYEVKIAILEAGEPIEVYHWEVHQRRTQPSDPYRYWLQPDGSLTPLKASRA